MNPAGEGRRISRVLPIGLALFASFAAPYALGIIPAAIKVTYLAAMLAASLVLPELCTDSLCECGCVRSGLAVVVRW